MIIGIDFDNTIAKYETTFKEVAIAEKLINKNWEGKTKVELRNYLRNQPDGEMKWMKLQGLVYGKYMNRAKLMPGVANFFFNCKQKQFEIMIISHKTQFGHFDPEKISLRQQAMKWMTNKRFFDSEYYGLKRENVFFADNRNKKLEIILKSCCNYFIDDLPEIFEDINFPDKPEKILFCQSSDKNMSSDESRKLSVFNNWEDISDYILGQTSNENVKFFAQNILSSKINSIERISGQGNSRIYKIQTKERDYVLKHYPDILIDNRPRLKTEYSAYELLHHHNIMNVPKAIRKDDDLNLGIYQWIEGKKTTEGSTDYLDQVINFVRQLEDLSHRINVNNICLASEACLSRYDLVFQIEQKFNRLNSIATSNKGLNHFLKETFKPLWQEIKYKSGDLWPDESKAHPLPKEKQTLNPSDFGFHNTLINAGKLTFIDFEYFGRDDPVKLTADFIWHPAMSLTPEQISRWECAMLELFSNDSNFSIRLQAALPIYGMRWVMILLNEFIPSFLKRRKQATQLLNDEENTMRDIQLTKAKMYCKRVVQFLNK